VEVSTARRRLIATEDGGVKIYEYPDGRKVRVRPKGSGPPAVAPVFEEAARQPDPNFRCVAENSGHRPSGCPDFYLDRGNPNIKYLCPNCGARFLLPLD